MLRIARVALLSFGLLSLAACDGDGIFSDGDDGGAGGSNSGAGGTGGAGGAGGGSQLTFFSMNEGLDLVRFTAGTLTTPTIITTTGIVGDGGASPPIPRSMDFRPSNNQLFVAFSDKRLYTINVTTGVATQVGTLAIAADLVNGLDWNPVPDKLRVLAGSVENYRFNDDGTLLMRDTDLVYVAGDAHAGQPPGPGGVAYTGNNAGVTTAYMIDTTFDSLARLGSLDGTPDSPNTGRLTTIGSGLGLSSLGGSSKPGFDINTAVTPNLGYVLDVVNGQFTRLYSVNLSTGTAAVVGSVGNNVRLQGLALANTTGSGGSGGAGGTGGSTTLLHDGSALGPVVDPLDEALVTPISEAGGSVILEPLADAALNPLLDALGAEAPGGGGGGGSDPLDPAQLCAIPTLGPALVAAVGGSCDGGGGGGGSQLPLDPSALCAIPTLGPAVVEAAGSTCDGGGGGGSDPLDPAQLCAVPSIGPALAEAAGATCP